MRSGRRQGRILVVQPRAVNVAGSDRLDARPSGLGIGLMRGASTALKIVRRIIPARCLDLDQTRRLLPRYHVRHASYLKVPMIMNHLIGLLAHPRSGTAPCAPTIRSSITWWDSSPARLFAGRGRPRAEAP